jgi:tetratricopeptide (TPR) repeat protein
MKREVAKVLSGEPPSESLSWKTGGQWTMLALVSVVLVAAGIFLTTLSYELVWDDGIIVQHVTDTARKPGPAALFSAKFLPDVPAEYYRPLVLLSFWVDSRIAGTYPHIFHLTNILLHALNAGLVFVLLRLLLPSITGPLFGALLFAVHPVHTESVAFVSGRTDLWAALFMLISTILWLRWRQEPRRVPAVVYGGAFVTFFLACLSKETAYLLPIVLLAWEGMESPLSGGTPGISGWVRRNTRWIILWGLAGGATLLMRWVVAGIGSPGGAPNDPVTVLRLWLTYARLLLVPWPLRYYYRAADLDGWLSIVPAVILMVLCLWGARKGSRRMGLMALAWMVIFLLPVAGPVRPSGAALAERFLYIPSIGAALLAGYWLDRATRARSGRFLAYPLAAVAVVAMGAAVFRQAPAWKDNLTFYTRFAKSCPDIPLAHYNLGNALKAANQIERSIGEYRTAIALDPNYREAWLNLGQAYDTAGRLKEAEESYVRLLEVAPDSYRAHANLGHILVDLGRWPEALESFRRASRLKPDDAGLHYSLGVIHSRLEQREEAVAEFRRTVELDAGYTAAYFKLGALYLQMGRIDLANREAAILERLDTPKALQLRQLIGR